nr:unnamed protein product [Callosobruchus analis]
MRFRSPHSALCPLQLSNVGVRSRDFFLFYPVIRAFYQDYCYCESPGWDQSSKHDIPLHTSKISVDLV